MSIYIPLIIPFIAPFVQQVVFSNFNSYINSYLTSYFSSKRSDNHEQELDRLQMNRLLKWMDMFFYEKENEKEVATIKQAYHKELYSIYKTISSDYKQYEQWKIYNQSLWFIKTYRQKNTNALAQKILSDLLLFHECMNLFSKC